MFPDKLPLVANYHSGGSTVCCSSFRGNVGQHLLVRELVEIIATVTSKVYMVSGWFLLHDVSYVWCFCVPNFIRYGLSLVAILMRMFGHYRITIP